MDDRPTGTVTFLFSDVEGSTQLWADHADDMERALERHDEILKGAIGEHGGLVFATTGDSFAASFARGADAVQASVDAQQRLRGESWPDAVPISVRIGLHTGEAQERGGDYFGTAVNRAARLMSVAHGGQILVSGVTKDLLVDAPVSGIDLVDLGLHRLKDLADPMPIFQVVEQGSDERFAPLRTLDLISNNLPARTDALLGREADVEALADLMSDHRLMTIIGAGGIGKTRLALEVAANEADRYNDGVWVCELAPVGDPEAVAQAVGQVLGARQHPGRSMADSVAEFCRRRRVLLVLDNCEHVLDAAGELVDALVARAPYVTVIATSREALGSRGEQIYPLASLAAADLKSPAVELFARRADEIRPGRTWNAAEFESIQRICSRLDGMPLAIELAASRTRSLSPDEIEQHLGDAFRSLRGGRRSVERHRTLEAAIDSSCRSLPEEEQRLFNQLSVFAGGFDLAAAEGTCSSSADRTEVIDLLDALVAKSLVIAGSMSGDPTRYRLLEPLRQYAEDRLARDQGADETRAAHLGHYTLWIEDWRSRLPDDGLGWRRELEQEYANIRAAIGWAIETEDTDRAVRIICSLEYPQALFPLFEIGDWAEAVLELPGVGDHQSGPTVGGVASGSNWWRNDIPAARRLAEITIAMPAADPQAPYPALLEAAKAAFGGDASAAIRLLGRIDRADPHTNAFIAWTRISYDPGAATARGDLAALKTVARSVGTPIYESLFELCAARIALVEGDPESATDHARRGVRLAESVGATFYVHQHLVLLSLSVGMTGDIGAEDLNLIRRCLREQHDAGQEHDQWLILSGAAIIMLRQGHRQLAHEIRRGVRASPWLSQASTAKVLEEFMSQEPELATESDTTPDLVDLVDQVIEAIEQTVQTLPPS
ncbi:MAG: adenylate/guanylate cyclase domain-containing protein [Acidimicrobiia bacterium]|nr:adenylate/guanylate cyclase domain-containing protein [Acidimicrobiia bacterium]